MRETWYVLADGTAADPALIRTGDDGRLVHEDGRAVAYGPHGPKSTGVDILRDDVPPRLNVEARPSVNPRGYKIRAAIKAD